MIKDGIRKTEERICEIIAPTRCLIFSEGLFRVVPGKLVEELQLRLFIQFDSRYSLAVLASPYFTLSGPYFLDVGNWRVVVARCVSDLTIPPDKGQGRRRS